MEYPVIAIDGTSASGKGTLARLLAERLGYAWLDTGKLYRCAGWAMIEAGKNPADEKIAAAFVREHAANLLVPAKLADPVLKTDAAGQAASQVAVHQSVRSALVDFQRDFAKHPPGNAKGAVLDGRDIGTVICPSADVKFFVTAYVEIRAQRRFRELQGEGSPPPYETVLADMKERDARDTARAAAPLKPAPDAILIDTGALTPEQVLEKALECVRMRLKPH